MTRVVTNEMSVEIPDPWEDRSISVFQSPDFNDTKLGVTASREIMTVPFDDYIEKDLVSLSRRLNRFEVIAKEPVKLGAAPAISARVYWEHESGPIYQRFFYMAKGERCLKITVTSLRKFEKECEAIAERLVRTARVREG